MVRSEPVVTFRRCAMAMSLAAVAAGLFFVYLLVSRTSPENSDEANILFMAVLLAAAAS